MNRSLISLASPVGTREDVVIDRLLRFRNAVGVVGVEIFVRHVELIFILVLVGCTQHFADRDRVIVEVATAVEVRGNVGASRAIVVRCRRPWADRSRPRRIAASASRKDAAVGGRAR